MFDMDISVPKDQYNAFIKKVEKIAYQAMETTAETIARDLQTAVKKNILSMGVIDSGTMYNNVDIWRLRDEYIVLVNVPYASYPEYGTGIYNTLGNGRKTPWVYQTINGEWRVTRGQKGKLFFSSAVIKVEKSALSTFIKMTERELSNGFS